MNQLYQRLCVEAASGCDIYVTYQGKTRDISIEVLAQALKDSRQGVLTEKDGVLHVRIGKHYVDWEMCGFTIVKGN